MENKGYLLLADGQLFEGTRFGAEKDVYAELVFTTAMTGYLETITDPSYEGQIVIQTFPTIGNYGVIPEDFESARPGLSAYVVREWCHDPSNFRCQGTLDDYLRREGIPGLCGLDTRRLTRRIRSAGVMNAALLMEKPENTDAVIAKLRALPLPSRGAGCELQRDYRGQDPGQVSRCAVGFWRQGKHPALPGGTRLPRHLRPRGHYSRGNPCSQA